MQPSGHGRMCDPFSAFSIPRLWVDGLGLQPPTGGIVSRAVLGARYLFHVPWTARALRVLPKGKLREDQPSTNRQRASVHCRKPPCPSSPA